MQYILLHARGISDLPMGNETGLQQDHRLCSEDEQVCAYSRDAALCNYSFLVRLHAHPSLQHCTW